VSTPLVSPAAMRDSRVRAAGFVLAIAVVALVIAAVGAVRVGSVQAAAPPPLVPDSALRIAAPGAGTDIAGAVAQDLFTDDRHAPAKRYLLPGEQDFTAEPAPRPSVLGTAIGSDGEHFAICMLPGGLPVTVRAGSKVGGYTVVSIERGKVIFRSAGGERFTLDAAKP
jgi:hypothetical protein